MILSMFSQDADPVGQKNLDPSDPDQQHLFQQKFLQNYSTPHLQSR